MTLTLRCLCSTALGCVAVSAALLAACARADTKGSRDEAGSVEESVALSVDAKPSGDPGRGDIAGAAPQPKRAEKRARLGGGLEKLGRAKFVMWGEVPDAFGDTPDADGFYSPRRHFDLSSADPIRRALVLLEKDPDGTLHLRFSKADIESMPALDEVLPAVREVQVGDWAGDGAEGSRRHYFRGAPGKVYSEEADPAKYLNLLAPPVPGFELRLWGSAPDSILELEAVEASSGKIIWRERFGHMPPERVEFFRPKPMRFFIFEGFDGGAVFDLDKGLVCRFEEGGVLPIGHFLYYPSASSDGASLYFGLNEVLWKLDLDGCRLREIGRVAPPKKEVGKHFDIGSSLVSPTGTHWLVAAGRTDRSLESPEGLRPVELQYLTFEIRSDSLVETRRVAARILNARLGIDGAFIEATETPFLVIHQYRGRRRIPATGALEIDFGNADICYLLVRNAHGRVFALRTPRETGSGFVVDRDRGWLRYGGKWWDLSTLAERADEDVIHGEG